jgi:hypothetical protein
MTETLAELVISEVKSRHILWDMKQNSIVGYGSLELFVTSSYK